MPVTIKIAEHGASFCDPPVSSSSSSSSSSSGTLFERSCVDQAEKCKEIIQSSFNLKEDDSLHASSNGFIEGAIKAYSSHHHLLIRPDDVWFAILTQLSIYINKHSEELRGKFVAPTQRGKKTLEVVEIGDRFSVDNGVMAEKMSHLVQKNVVDPELRAWIMPAFTTTSKKDEVVASILMMGSLQKYFTYKFRYRCGIPSVTLLGEKSDWEKICKRLEKLPTFGKEPNQWYHLLKPVLSRFVRTFDSQDDEISDFWARMINRETGSGIDRVSGWLSAFCFWNEDSQLLCRPPRADHALRLDGQAYGYFDMEDMPHGYATVPVICDDNGYKFDAVMLAGFVGIKCTSSGGTTLAGQVGLDTMQAESGWLMYEKKAREREV